MPVLVFGATGQIGHFLLPRLLGAGGRVVALSRQRHARMPGVQWLQGSLPDAVPALPELRAVISLGPLDALARWLAGLERAPAPRLLATSSMSVVTKRGSQVAAERELGGRLASSEQELARQCARLGMAWTVLRPTLIYGAGMDRSLTPIARRAMRWRLFPVPRARGLRQPVHADDLASAALAWLDSRAADGRILAFGGGERLPAGEMFARVRRSLPRAALPLPVGRPVLAALAALLPAARGPVSRLDMDLVADNGDAERLLGVRARPFRPDAAMWQAPGPRA